MKPIPFNRPHVSGKELWYIAEAHGRGQMAGDGEFTRQCQEWLEQATGARRALLTHSCTAAMEMMALLADIRPGDEVIMPSFTFVSTANAFALRGAVPVFVDVREDTLNLDESRLADAITERSRAIVPVHYAGVGCAMESILATARQYRLMVFEDAAQGISSRHRDQPLGSFGELAALSFHETKNVISGEGGALLINDPAMVERAEILREKGTNRSQFFRGQVDKYTWVDIGSSYLPGEIIAAFLWAQLQEAEQVTARRRAMWSTYHDAFADAERNGRIRRPVVPPESPGNGHLYYLLMRDLDDRTAFIEHMDAAGIQCVFHYVPLHSSPAGRRLGRCHGDLGVTESIADRLVRLPLWLGLEERQGEVIGQVQRYLDDNPR